MGELKKIEPRTYRFITAYKDLSEEGKISSNVELAKILGVKSKSTITEIIGKRQNIQPEAWEKFLRHFDLKEDNIRTDFSVPHENNGEEGADHNYPQSYQLHRHQQKLITVPTIPFYDAEAMAGTEYGADMTTITHPTGKIDIGDLLRDSKAALRVYGNSMIPGYPPGCVIGLVQNPEMIIHPGHVYVVETNSNRFVKRLYYTKDQKGLLCVSDNVLQHQEGPMKGEYFYPPFEIPFEKVKRLFEVTGVIKRNQSTMIIND